MSIMLEFMGMFPEKQSYNHDFLISNTSEGLLFQRFVGVGKIIELTNKNLLDKAAKSQIAHKLLDQPRSGGMWCKPFMNVLVFAPSGSCAYSRY